MDSPLSYCAQQLINGCGIPSVPNMHVSNIDPITVDCLALFTNRPRIAIQPYEKLGPHIRNAVYSIALSPLAVSACCRALKICTHACDDRGPAPVNRESTIHLNLLQGVLLLVATLLYLLI